MFTVPVHRLLSLLLSLLLLLLLLLFWWWWWWWWWWWGGGGGGGGGVVSHNKCIILTNSIDSLGSFNLPQTEYIWIQLTFSSDIKVTIACRKHCEVNLRSGKKCQANIATRYFKNMGVYAGVFQLKWPCQMGHHNKPSTGHIKYIYINSLWPSDTMDLGQHWFR